ncbi:hypothetical protein HAL_30700 [Haladaptatus sp. T7]|nr:hypothetical protein HAL_30700 [Haladaptatus sp. T7]
MRVECEILEHHCDIAVPGFHIVNSDIIECDFTLRGFLESPDHTEGSCLSAAARTEENEKFTVINCEREIINGDNLSTGAVESLGYVTNF